MALLAVVLVGAVILSYQPAWHAGFIWDDDEYVTHNPLITAPDGLWRIWFSTDSPSQYFPLVYTSFRFQHALWGMDPAGYHWVNILLHAFNALLVWHLLARLAIPGAWLGAALFALHPLQAESVAWITELKNIQSLFFSLLVLLLWERFTAPAPVRPRLLYAAALACHALALFSKTTACTLPAGLVLILWLRDRPLAARRWLQIAPFVLMGLVMGLVSIWWERHQQGTVGDEFAYGAIDRLLIAARALCFYFGKLLWPENLAFSYSLWSIDARSPAAWAWFLPLLALAATVLALRHRLGRGPETALVFFVASLFPLLGFFMLYTFRYTFVADHYVYVALIGPAALAGAAATRLVPGLRRLHPTAPACAAALLLLGLATLTWRQSRMYENLRTLWTTTIERTPTSYMAHNNLGAVELAEGRIDQAVSLFERSLTLKPDHLHALANLANARLTQGRIDDALALFSRVVELAPHDAKGHSDLGQALEKAGRFADSGDYFRRAIELDPRLAEAHQHLGRWLIAHDRAAEAEAHLTTALSLHPDYAEAHYHLGLIRLAQSRPEDAASCFERTLTLEATHPFALHNLGLLRAQAGQLDPALALLQQAVAAAPSAPGPRHHLAQTLAALGRLAEAEAALVKTLRLDPAHREARIDLAQTQVDQGHYTEAAATLELHLRQHPDDHQVRHGLGLVLAAAGRPADAARAFRAVLAALPDHAESRAALAALPAMTP